MFLRPPHNWVQLFRPQSKNSREHKIQGLTEGTNYTVSMVVRISEVTCKKGAEQCKLGEIVRQVQTGPKVLAVSTIAASIAGLVVVIAGVIAGKVISTYNVGL